jgi:hypothetical protein
MARRKTKKLVSQQIVGTAAAGLPEPCRQVLGSRWGARLALLLVAALFATGIATLDWSTGWPKLKINRERAQEVRTEIYHDAEALAERIEESRR